MDGLDTPDRAVSLLEKEVSNNPALPQKTIDSMELSRSQRARRRAADWQADPAFSGLGVFSGECHSRLPAALAAEGTGLRSVSLNGPPVHRAPRGQVVLDGIPMAIPLCSRIPGSGFVPAAASRRYTSKQPRRPSMQSSNKRHRFGISSAALRVKVNLKTKAAAGTSRQKFRGNARRST
jgi:hypothetical protein